MKTHYNTPLGKLKKVALAFGFISAIFATSLHAQTLATEADLNRIIRGPTSAGNTPTGTAAVLVGDTSSGDQRYINLLLQFDLSDISLQVNESIDSVSLSFTVLEVDSSSVNAAVTFDLYQSARAFTGDATWSSYKLSTPWETAGGTGAADRGPLLGTFSINPSTVGSAGTVITLQGNAAMVSLVESLAGTASPLNLWFGLNPVDMDGLRHVLRFASNTHPTYAGPTLNVTVIPEPSVLLFIAFAAATALVYRRRLHAS